MDFPSVLVSVSEWFFFPDVKVSLFTVHKYSVGDFFPALRTQNRCKPTARFLLYNSGFSWKENTPVLHPALKLNKPGGWA